jgi:formyltetrahydrofolate-dependent phosphoribosylglycinamide formyltransferase
MAIRLGVLVSGGGTTLQNLIDRIENGRLQATIAVVVSSRDGIVALERARRHGTPATVVPIFGVPVSQYSKEVFAWCRRYEVELVVLGGYLHLLQIPADFAGRVMNIHPALIPAFCGKGYYGLRVHQAVIDRGVKITGCTVHFADNEYDHGPIILQRVVEVKDDDTAERLAERVFAAECEAYPEAIQLFAQGRLRIEGRRVTVRKN